MSLWRYAYRGNARETWRAWYSWAIRCQLEPIKAGRPDGRAAPGGIITAIVRGVANARSEGINAKIQWLKYTTRRSRKRQHHQQDGEAPILSRVLVA